MNILEKVLVQKRRRLKERENRLPFQELLKRYEENKTSPKNLVPPRQWLLTPHRFHIVAEVKRASPSKGNIPWSLSLEEIVQSYESGGVSMISVLTEEDLFLGGIPDFEHVRRLTSLPLLRKDFIFTEYQLYESALIGADAILLIVSILEDNRLKVLHRLAHELGLKALVECRDEHEIHRALEAGAEILGINNRDLRTFEIDLNRTRELGLLVPDDCILISESGIHTPQDAATVSCYGADAILVGESCVHSSNPSQHIAALLRAGEKRGGDANLAH